MIETLSSLSAELAAPGRVLAFCDETDLTGNDGTATMRADIHLHAAVVLPSGGYGVIAASLGAALDTFGVEEFHAVDIVNNGKKSVWYERSPEDRLAALTTICDALHASGAHVYYVQIPKEQYDGLVAALPPGSLPEDHKDAVKACFRASIAALLDTSTSAMVVADKDKNSKSIGLAKVDGGNHLIGGGIVLAASEQVIGLQLADAATYIIGRYIRRRDGMVAKVELDEEIGAFDSVVADGVGRLHGRLHSLLSEPALFCEAA
ncbi:hypothetical protein TPR58_14345 [Sphingomonas sp. HF-S3]|uniref:DUF3800 domain-containing protein n=1 Tax=Sphingomonas rustica TaxID=3103142 RepID=A0ABV0BBU2_9SPHN